MRQARLAVAAASIALVVGAGCTPATPSPRTSPQSQAAPETQTDSSAHAARATAEAQTAAEAVEADEEALTGWFCPMHPDVTAAQPGKCTKCEMQLIAGNPFDTREYQLDLRTSPPAVEPGVPFTMQLTVRHPATGKPVRKFETVHEKQFHLFVISQDMSSFQHIHPELNADGAWQIQVTVPKSGYYRVLSDFVPTGGSPQFLGRTLVTSGFDGDLLSQAAKLTADTSEVKSIDTITADLALDPEKLIAGQYGHLMFTFTDAKTGEPVRDLQPYLGAFGHTLILSEDMLDVVHSHPSPGPDNDISKGFGGPRVMFEGYLPRPGLYRAWTQLLRNDTLTTFSYTFRVFSVDEAYRTTR
jgi:hypothetical protein